MPRDGLMKTTPIIFHGAVKIERKQGSVASAQVMRQASHIY